MWLFIENKGQNTSINMDNVVEFWEADDTLIFSTLSSTRSFRDIEIYNKNAKYAYQQIILAIKEKRHFMKILFFEEKYHVET